MHTPIRCVIFDLFGTLISVSKAVGGRGRHTADILGIDRRSWQAACFSEHHEICRPTSQEEIIGRLARSIDPEIPHQLIEEASLERQWRFDHALREIEDDILQFLERLRAGGIRLGLISNASTDEVRGWSASPLAPHFECVLFSCECGMKKPDPAIYRLALERLESGAQESLFIGDGGSNEHAGASRSGIRSLLTTYFLEGCSEQELRLRGDGSIGTIAHVSELVGYLRHN